MPPIADYPLRYQLSNELHARPFPSLAAPATALYLAIKRPDRAAARDSGEDRAHLIDLLDRFGATHPSADANHYSGEIGRHQLKWESHTEFVTYTIFKQGVSDRPFDPTDFDLFPADWLERAPGARITSAIIRLTGRSDDSVLQSEIDNCFVSESLAVARVLDDAAVVAGDFRIDPAGHTRFAVSAPSGTGPRRLGRIVQRLCEIETYKTVSMLGFARVRGMSARMAEIDTELTRLIAEMSTGERPAEETLKGLLSVSAELEGMVAESSFRFSATAAYQRIVQQRVEVLGEERYEGRQTFAEFMMRRYEPAMRTVEATERRLGAMADRAMRAGDLLRTRVDVERSAQNQALLESMDRRADAQLRLQRTVEGLSVVAISYYAVSLAGYLLYPMAAHLGMSGGLMTAAITLPVIGTVWWVIARIRNSLH
ncbi:DUF3422 family protein [Roseovarius pelagicus]|uniref:DUF3422 domain-containing protein n=1 Tax=Roseovarius pelagicus TaxID=2980108 RepID=A0ABY6DCY7_9RHOB|nr:DUF3422 domain-containing protein [Roseovarius pelagicus]UXX84007.1 DUF3422 domain-containing protein [Roseovarius pelagicus]